MDIHVRYERACEDLDRWCAEYTDDLIFGRREPDPELVALLTEWEPSLAALVACVLD